MTSQTITNLKAIAIGLFFAAIGWVIVSEYRNASRHRNAGQMVWFYDESEKQLYPMPINTIPPDKGIGGPSGDGYRAIVVGFTGYKKDKSLRKIAYLEKYSPELKQILDSMIAARIAGRIFTGIIPGRQSQYFQNNTFVKRRNDTEWYPANSDEGRRIVGEWREWRGPDGGGAAVCPVD